MMTARRSLARVPTPFDREVANAQKRMEDLGRLAGGAADRRKLLQQVLQELSIAINELQVAADEMSQQSVIIAETREQAEDLQRRYQDLFDLAPDGYIVTGPKGDIRAANQAAG